MMSADRPPVITGNWKMHKTIEQSIAFVRGLLESFRSEKNRVELAVPYTVIYPLSLECKDTPIRIGAQNMNEAAEGSFTGEIAAKMLSEAGADFVLLGHSERRILYGESDDTIRLKVLRAIEENLPFILCVGETSEEHRDEKTREIIERQLRTALGSLESFDPEFLTIAYEPVWAIGTGTNASPEFAQGVHRFCREVTADLFSKSVAEKTIIQYGGSVNSTNARELLACPDIDGLLIGGASLSLESFLQIVNDDYSKFKRKAETS